MSTIDCANCQDLTVILLLWSKDEHTLPPISSCVMHWL